MRLLIYYTARFCAYISVLAGCAGFIDHEHNCIYGDWFIEATLLDEDGNKEKEPHIFKGIWFLSKTGK
jgi:hypothetical protein